MLAPAVSPGDAVPVPPFDVPTMPVRLMAGVAPPEEASGDEAVTEVTGVTLDATV